MPFDPAELSVPELRRHLLEGGGAVSPQLLRKLQRDPRRGVRQLFEALRRRRESVQAESRRLEALLHFERVLWRAGIERVAGVDESGVGPLAGPVVAAAVVFPPGTEIAGVDDSKRLDAARREGLAATIRERAASVGVGIAEVEEVDALNVYHAALLAMRRAVEALSEPPQHLLVDAREVPGVAVPQNRFDKGDGINFSIAAASIVAKTRRDALMVALDERYPEYGFAGNKGYGTAEHQEAIRRHGPCPAHRASYGFLRELCGEHSPRFYGLQGRLWGADGAAALTAAESELAAARADLAEEEYRKLRLICNRRWKGMSARP
jgi:ribonuclease HII